MRCFLNNPDNFLFSEKIPTTPHSFSGADTPTPTQPQYSKTSSQLKPGNGPLAPPPNIIKKYFRNGVHSVGQFSPDGLEGAGEVFFPEGTYIRGVFEHSSLRRAIVEYSRGVHAKFDLKTGANVEEALDSFEFVFLDRAVVRGRTNEKGNIDSALVIDFQGRVLGEARPEATAKQRFRLFDGEEVVVSKSWIYVGQVREQASAKVKSKNAVEFGDRGEQVWVKGLGYFSIVSQGGLIKKSFFRIYKAICLFREMVFKNEKQIFSTNCYPNGFFFVTKEDPHHGIAFIVNRNLKQMFQCRMDDFMLCEGKIRTLGEPLLEFQMIKTVDGLLIFQNQCEELNFVEFLSHINLRDKPHTRN